MKTHTPQLCIRLLTIALCLVFLSACAGQGRYEHNPRVTLADIRLQDIKTMESTFLVELRIINPNEAPLEVSGIECNLEIDGRDFASGVAGGQYVIPPYGSALVPVTVYASMLDMVSSVVTILRGASGQTQRPEPLRYALSGHVRVGGNVYQQSIPFESEGTISLEGIR